MWSFVWGEGGDIGRSSFSIWKFGLGVFINNCMMVKLDLRLKWF